MSNKEKINKNYVSELGQFLQEFDYKHKEKSVSQQKEISKHDRIAKARDEVKEEGKAKIWKKF